MKLRGGIVYHTTEPWRCGIRCRYLRVFLEHGKITGYCNKDCSGTRDARVELKTVEIRPASVYRAHRSRDCMLSYGPESVRKLVWFLRDTAEMGILRLPDGCHIR